jgi:hypothetical protein
VAVRIEFGDPIVGAAVADCVHPGRGDGESGQLGKACIGGCAQYVEDAGLLRRRRNGVNADNRGGENNRSGSPSN